MTVLFADTVHEQPEEMEPESMPPLNRFAPVLAILATAALMAPAVSAANKQGSIEVAGSLTFQKLDPQIELNEDAGPNLLVGYNFTKRHGMELFYTSFEATPDSGANFPVDVDIFKIGYTFNAYPREKLVSFFRAGLGSFILHPESKPGAVEPLQDSVHRILFYSGAGVRFFLNDTIAIRLDGTIDLIDRDGLATGDVNFTGGLGLSFILGGHEPDSTD